MNYISRSGGKKGRGAGVSHAKHQFSVTAAIAYRTGSIVTDYRTGMVHDYRRKGRVEHSEIVAPKVAPSWTSHRETLWNAVEAAEVRKDARLANEFILCLPYSMTREQEISMVREFAQAAVERHGVAIEFAIHKDDPKRWDGAGKRFDGRHAHVLMTTRALLPDGFSKSKAREFSGQLEGPKTLEFWRERWAEIGNRHMADAGLAERWDQRTLEAQREEAQAQGEIAKAVELDRMPGVHLGAAATAFERRGIETFIGDLNRAIAAENQARRLAHKCKGVEATLDEFEQRLAELRKEQEAEWMPIAEKRGREDSRWPEYERELMRLGMTEHRIDLRYLQSNLQFIEDRFVELADAMEAQGFGVSELARRMVAELAELDSPQSEAAVEVDDEMEPDSDDPDAAFEP
ncbi:MobA/MobL family protein [Xanthomonas citri pv. punicae]|nr:MobQ family relaxase [Xanthomonas citri]MBE0315560.1 MobA/MobL family protein [Xanthomonas citri pv. punicae]MDS0832483.1 MobA/MobL family protein [Xanthomonas citri pv. punicae]MDS0836348.1 MobA/MobL family protein [Xanthomonas citri pv. punicae]